MLARQVLKITKWLWPVVLIPLAIALIPLFIQAKKGDFLYVFLVPGPVRTISLAVLVLLLLIPFVAWIVTLVDGGQSNNKLLREYLRAVVSDNTGLSPTGIAPPPSAALISINVPLSKIFIHLRADAKRPVHDILVDREKALEELRQRLENHPERREEFEEYRARLWEDLSRRSLDTPDYRVWRLDDVLFDALRALVG